MDNINPDPALVDAIAHAVAIKLVPLLSPVSQQTLKSSETATDWLGKGKAAAALGISDYALGKQHSRLRLGTDYRVAQSGRGQYEYHVKNCRSKISG